MTNLCAYDIEISDIFPDTDDMEQFAPFHVSLGTTVECFPERQSLGEGRIWFSEDDNKDPALNMTAERARQMLNYLRSMQNKGFTACGWNGFSFDLRWLGYHAKDPALAATVALDSYDPMFQFFMMRGFPISLAKVGEAMGIPQKKVMSGADAPKAWRDGQWLDVMDYCMGDSELTAMIATAIIEEKEIRWITQQGKLRSQKIDRLLTVDECLGLPMPDTSWMDAALPLSYFVGWLESV